MTERWPIDCHRQDDAKIRRAAGADISGFSCDDTDRPEATVQNLNQRVTQIEQILPTLATTNQLETLGNTLREELASKRDLDAMGRDIRAELALRFDEAKRYAQVLHEDLKSDIGLIAEHLADVMSRLPPGAP